ncbi:MAG: hypothetical protein Q8M01_07450 [Rubrivivax sp.]|nr:hypothetical protein [Rubrivivax sp.]
MKLRQQRHGLQHRHAPGLPGRRLHHRGQWRGPVQRLRFVGDGDGQREAVAAGRFVELQHGRYGLPRQVQARQPGLDAARPGGLARAVEVAASGAEEQLGNLAFQGLGLGRSHRTRFSPREYTAVQQQRKQQPGLVPLRQRGGLATLPALHQAGRHAGGRALHDVAHRGVEFGRQPAQDQRVRGQQHQLGNHGALGQQVPCQQAQLPQRGQPSGQIVKLRRRDGVQQIKQLGQRADGRAARLDAGHRDHGAIVDRQPQPARGQGNGMLCGA